MTETAENPDGKYAGWVILELMGHRRLSGFLSEQEIAGRAFLRLDIPSNPPATQFYGPEAVYCITPTTEEMACAVAAIGRVAPVQRWELPRVADREIADDAILAANADYEPLY